MVSEILAKSKTEGNIYGSLVEANRKDVYFSCGLSLADPNIIDTNKCKGKSVLGKIITMLREKFKQLDTVQD